MMMMKKKVNLPLDLIEEILSKLPITCLKAMKSTFKGWNVLSKNRMFQEEHCGKAAKEFMFMIMVDTFILLDTFTLRLCGINYHIDLVDPFINQIGTLNTQVRMSKIFHCDGLLLVVNRIDLMVWNPYLSKFKWIYQPNPHCLSLNLYVFVMGYDNNKHHKILRFCHWGDRVYEIFDFMSNSWRVLYRNRCLVRNCGVSFKGNNYFIDVDNCLRCFDFTKERFEKALPLPYSSPAQFARLSVVKQEQLAVAVLRCDCVACETHIQIWITTKIEPSAVSWRSFINVNMNFRPYGLESNLFFRPYGFESFYVEEKKKVAVICYTAFCGMKVCMIKEDGYYNELEDAHEMITSSYVPRCGFTK